jgi:uncharacterized RDD family membrane protein YckC
MTQMTSVPMEDNLEYAGIWKRVLASLIDLVILAVIGLGLGMK